MGYRSTVSGEMKFSRSLTEMEQRTLKPALDDDWSVWGLDVETETREVTDGTWSGVLTRTEAVGLTVIEEDEVKTIGYDWDKTLQKIIRLLPDDVSVSGYFHSIGEDSDQERLYVSGRTVHIVRPVITWPIPEGASE